ncbi:MAG: hypothetical protein Q8941_20545 [Bacteroidota bacterium]|nr:hypothetical protein [Bacteroidota bacterium]
MPPGGGQNIIDVAFDPAKFAQSKDQIIAGLQEVKQAAQELPAQFKATFDSIVAQSNTGIKVGSSGGIGELKAQIAALQKTTEQYRAENDKLNESLKTGSTAASGTTKATKELTLEQAKVSEQTKANNANIRAQAREALGLNDAYKQLVIRFAAASAEARNLAVQYGVNSKEAQAAAREALGLNNQLKAIDESIGNHQRNVGNYNSAVESATEKIKHFGLELLSLVGIFSVASFFKDSVDAFLELDKATRLLQNTLKNVGAPELFGRIEESTKKLTTQFKFLREEDIQTAFNKLIVYGKLSENQINDLLPVIINLATATGQTIPEATSLLLKSLEGNNRGLKEFGINIKDAKDPAERLSLVMKELAPRVQGVADAFGESSAGKIAASREELRKLKEEVGEGLIPVFTALLSGLDKVLTGLGYLGKKTKEVFEDILTLGKSADLRAIEKQAEIEQKIADSFVEGFKDKPVNDVTEALHKLNGELADRKRKLIEAKVNYSDIFTDEDRKQLELQIRINNLEYQGLVNLQTINKNKILGPGDPNAGGKDKKDKGASEAAKAAEEQTKAEFEIFKLEAQRRADFDEEIYKNEKLSYSDRLLALNDFARIKQTIIDGTAKSELRELKIKTDAELSNDKLSADERLAIQNNYNAQVNLIYAKQQDATLRLAHSLTDALKKVASGLKTTEVAFTSAVGGMTKSIQKEIDELHKALKKGKEDREAAIKKEHDLEIKTAEEAFAFVQKLGDAKFENEKNRIQKLIDANNEYASAETERINNSTLSEQDKAAKLIQLKAETDEKNKELAKKQKEEDIKKAKFDKAFAIAKILETTAQAEVEALTYLSNPFTASLYPGIAALIATIGALQLAAAIATPIPTYAEGTDDHKGGIARYGEAGPEAVVLPDGRSFIADKDTIGFLPRHAKVIPLTADRVNDVMSGSMVISMSERMAIVEAAEKRASNDAWKIAKWQTEETVRALNKMDNRPKVVVKNNIGADFHLWVNKYVNGR